MWQRVEAGRYRSRDKRFEVLRQTAFEDEGDQDAPPVPMQWFLYERGDLIDAYDTLREAKRIAETRP